MNEELFKPLFSAENGAPNAPIRVLVGMMILKEGRGISNERLFAHARFNMLARSALGLLNMDEKPPVESTYYLLRQRIAEYEKRGGVNLMERVFKELTGEQCIQFEVNGKLMYVLVKTFKGRAGQEAYETLKWVFEEQYQVVRAAGEKKTAAAPLDTERAEAKSVESWYGGEHRDRAEQAEIVPRETKEIGTKSIQSPHDTEYHYRNKNGNTIRGI
jgi:hypothetical protein